MWKSKAPVVLGLAHQQILKSEISTFDVNSGEARITFQAKLFKDEKHKAMKIRSQFLCTRIYSLNDPFLLWYMSFPMMHILFKPPPLRSLQH